MASQVTGKTSSARLGFNPLLRNVPARAVVPFQPIGQRARSISASFSSSSPVARIGRATRAPIVVPRAVVAPDAAAATPVAQDDGKQQSTAYPFPDIEKKWQEYWAKHKTFRTPDEVDMTKPKYYVLDMFPYPRCVSLQHASPYPLAQRA